MMERTIKDPPTNCEPDGAPDIARPTHREDLTA